MRRLAALSLLLALLATPAWGQASGGRCLLQILNVDRQGAGTQPSPGVQNWYAGGNVRMRCVGQEVRMWSDSVASYSGQVVQFIGAVRYRDSTVDMTADFGTYYRDSERWEARGNVVLTNRKNGAVLRGPNLDYLREVPGVRDTSELFADIRPVITITAADSVERPDDPYRIEGDRVRIRGEDQVYVGGRVTIDRSDLAARADSLRLDTGLEGNGTLLGSASVRQTAADSFDLRGRRIDLDLERREVTWVLAQGAASLEATELNLEADTIGIDLDARRVQQVLAWGTESRPHARSADGFEVRGDSVAFDTPDQRLDEARAFGRGWMGAAPDSVTRDRDYVAGDTVTVTFRAGADSAGAPRSLLDRLEARGQALAFYRVAPPPGGDQRLAIVYTHATHILITMKEAADGSSAVDEVRMVGAVDGIHLQPAPIVTDTTRAARPRPPSGAAR
jgi:hypothetical protein